MGRGQAGYTKMTDDSRIEIERDVKPLLSSGGGDGVGYGSDADPDD